MAEDERSYSAPTGIRHSRGKRNFALAEMSMETKTVPGHLRRETCPSRSCPWGMGCMCLVVGLLDAFWLTPTRCFRASRGVTAEVIPGFRGGEAVLSACERLPLM